MDLGLGPLVLAIGQVVIGAALGVSAGYVGGFWDSAIMRYVDLMWAMPGLLVAIVVVGIVGGGYWAAVGLLIFLNAPNDIRMSARRRSSSAACRTSRRRGRSGSRAGGSWCVTSGRTSCRSS